MSEPKNPLKALLNGMTDGIYVVNPDRKQLLYCNEKIKEMTGAVKAAGTCYQVLYRREEPCPDCPIGQKSRGEALCKAVELDWEGIPAVAVICTEEKAESLAGFVPAAGNLLSGGIMISAGDPDEQLQYLSEAFERILGYTEAEIRQSAKQHFRNLIDPDDYLRVRRQKEQWLAEHARSYELQFRAVRKDGSVIWVLEQGTLLDDFYGKNAYLRFFVDLTKQKAAAEEKKRETALVMRDRDMMIAAARIMFPLCICANLSRNSYYIIEYERFNTQKASDTGSFDDLITVGASTIPKEDRGIFLQSFSRESLLRAYRDGKQVISLTHRQTGDDGVVHWNRTTVIFVDNPIDDDVLEIILSLCVDDLKKAEEKLKDALRGAKKANNAKSDFLSRMSHEIRTPLNAILGISELGMDQCGDPELSRDAFCEIQKSGTYLLGLINDILDMSRIERGKLELHEELTNGPDFLEGIEKMIRPLAESRNMTLLTDFSKAQTQWIYMDRMRTQQLYLNLLNNAIKFSPDGSTVEWKITDEIVSDTEMHMVSVIRDHGCGMSAEFQKKLFTPFTQEQNSLPDERQGTGLGLSIVKSIVDKMHGEILVESELGKGSTFTVKIPRRIQKDVAETVLPKSNRSEAELRGKKVLLCEDHPINTKIIVRMLEKAGMQVTHAENGKIGVSLFEKSSPFFYDLILMDVRMPEMDGLEAARQIRKANRPDAQSVPIIAMTANAFDEDRKKTMEAGMNAHLSKPVGQELLYRTIWENIK